MDLIVIKKIILGPFFICLFSIIITVLVLFLYFLYNKIPFVIFAIGLVISFIQLSSYLYTALINPGIPKIEYEEMSTDPNNNNNFRFCKECKLWTKTSERTYHCYECEICIEGFDHHCPWTSKCIGKHNLISFFMFVGFTLILFGYLILSISFINPNYN